MCGIAGIMYSSPQRRVDPGMLDRMARTIAHRGPNDSSVWTTGGVGLAHRRLSIIDLEGGHQPIGNEDGSIQIIFNGEIYNYRDLRSDLQARGHVMRTDSDTEVLVHSYEEWGDDFVDAAAGHVRVRDLGRAWPAPAPGPGPARDQAALHLPGPREAAVRLRAQGDPLRAERGPGGRRQALEEYLAFGRTLGERSIFRGDREVASGPRRCGVVRLARAGAAALLAARARADETLSVAEWQRGGSRQGHRCGQGASRRRRAGRRLPERRAGLQHRRRLRQCARRSAAADVLDRIRRAAVQRAALREGCRGRRSAPATPNRS